MDRPLNPSGGQAWFVAASPAERFALVKVFLSQKTQVSGSDARKHRRLRDALRIGHIIETLKANADKVKATRARDEVLDLRFTITAENLEWLGKLLEMVPVPGEDAILIDGLLERIEEAKAGHCGADEIADWTAAADNWTPPVEEPAEPDELVCPSCHQVFHPDEARKPNGEARAA